ncbi:MAG: infa: translation initiation factor if [Verrucomicrobiales bacterium]|nr:infa: translation initiation factor if [Verrucomicrobiales bacterium]
MPAHRNNSRSGPPRRPSGPPRPYSNASPGANSGGYRRPPAKEVDPEGEIEVDGTIVQVLAGTMFKVELSINRQIVLAHISGKMRKRFIRLVVGDRVKMEMSPYDTTKARITYRM